MALLRDPSAALASFVQRRPVALLLAWALLSTGAFLGAVGLIGVEDMLPEFFAGTHPDFTQISREATAVMLLMRDSPYAFAAVRDRWQEPSPLSPPPLSPPALRPPQPPDITPPAIPSPPSPPPSRLVHAPLEGARLDGCVSVSGFEDCASSDMDGSVELEAVVDADGAQRLLVHRFEMRIHPDDLEMRIGFGGLGGVKLNTMAGSALSLLNETVLSSPLVGEPAAFTLEPHWWLFNGTIFVDGYGLAGARAVDRRNVPHLRNQLSAARARRQ